jgi:aryl-alcohol dehydrogenase-like predicted oxidoreductase
VEYRRLGKTGRSVSAIGFGAWAIGGSWGNVDDATSLRALHAAADAGVTLIDTADVYGDGHSERLIGRFLRERSGESFFVATKMGRSVPQVPENYNPKAFRAWVDASRERLGVDKLDLIQLHCPPTPVFYSPETFAALDELVADGSIANYGVSVEKVEEALKAIEFPGVASVQIIYNVMRQRPADHFLAEAERRDVGVLARVPLASGMLTGKMTRATKFEADDHRQFNRHGESFDVGETFAGVDYEVARARRRDDGPVRPALDPHVRRSHGRDPRRQEPRPGPRQRRRGRPGAPAACHSGEDPDPLRRAHQAPGPPALVGERRGRDRHPGAVATVAAGRRARGRWRRCPCTVPRAPDPAP